MGAGSSIQQRLNSRPNTPKEGKGGTSAPPGSQPAPLSGSGDETRRPSSSVQTQTSLQETKMASEESKQNTESATTRPTIEGRTPEENMADNEQQRETVSNKQAQRVESMEPKDLMISYSHQDRDRMRQMRAALENAGITVWVDETGLKAGVEFLNKIGQAIIDAKVFLTLLSTKSAASKYCKDELALAYVSSKPIFPCMIEPRSEVDQVMDFGMKLQLAPIPWFDFSDEALFKDSLQDLTESIKAKLREMEDEQNQREQAVPKKPGALQRRETRSRLYVHQNKPEAAVSRDFWEEHFQEQNAVTVKDFVAVFQDSCTEELAKMGVNLRPGSFVAVFQDSCTEELAKMGVSLDWIIPIIEEELDEEHADSITKENYEHFCTIDDQRLDFWARVKEQALERYTMLEVFSMDSSVRLDAIQNLAKFHSRSVIEAMMDLCSDRDDNVRAVAALSLARVASSGNLRVVRRLLRLLKDRDRLVRQSGCLALGHMRAKQAVPSLVQLWRNDAISNVREAAHVALEKIGGEEAQEAIHITKVLSAEIKALAQQK